MSQYSAKDKAAAMRALEADHMAGDIDAEAYVREEARINAGSSRSTYLRDHAHQGYWARLAAFHGPTVAKTATIAVVLFVILIIVAVIFGAMGTEFAPEFDDD